MYVRFGNVLDGLRSYDTCSSYLSVVWPVLRTLGFSSHTP